MKQFIFRCLTTSLLCSSMAVANGQTVDAITVTIELNPLATSSFADVATNAWYHPYVEDMAQGGYVSGKSATSYGPMDTLTTAEFTTMLANAFYGETVVQAQKYNSDIWWTPYMGAALDRNGLTNTTAYNEFQSTGNWGSSVNDPVSRYDMAVMMTNLLQEQNLATLSSSQLQTALSSITDSIPSSYQTAVATAFHYGFLTGRTDGSFDGNASLTRAEASVVLSGLVKSPYVKEENAKDFSSDSTGSTGSTDSSTTATRVQEVFDLVNEERAKVGLTPYIWHDTLMEAAQFKSDEMKQLNYYDHDSPVYGSFDGIITKFGITYTALGENISRGQSSAASVMDGWMNSEGHRDNILSSVFTHIGIGYNDGYWTQQFLLPSGTSSTTPTPSNYSLTSTKTGNGTVTLPSSSVQGGSVVTVHAVPDSGYKLSAITVNGAEITANSSGSATFTMPSKSSTVHVTFEAVTTSTPSTTHQITSNVVGSGTVNVSATSAKADTTVLVTTTPSSGYELTSLTMNGTALAFSHTGSSSFTMPDASAVVTATFQEVKEEEQEETTYNLTASGSNGSIAFSSTSAKAGETITVSTTAHSGYELSGLTLNGTPLTFNDNGSATFTMPIAHVTVVGTFTKTVDTTEYNITTLPSTQGTLILSDTKATSGTTISFTARGNTGFELSHLLVNGTKYELNSSGTGTFVMPAADVEVEAVFQTASGYYDISYETPENGTVSVTQTSVLEGSSVSATLTPESGYEVDTVKMNGTVLTVSNNRVTFTMPSSNVTLDVTFQEIPSSGISLGSGSSSSLQSYSNSIARWASTDAQDIFVVGSNYVVMDATSGNIVLTTYDQSFKQISTKTIQNPLSLFGGFTYGSDGNYYAVFGQANSSESATQEVYRVVKYDSSFNQLASYSVKGSDAYTVTPFSSGSASLVESNGTLIVHASRLRHKSLKDGLNHQSQFTMVLDSTNMTLKNTLGEYQGNHVSHSFDQFAAIDGNTLLMLDHGDAYPRSIVLHTSTNGGVSYKETDLLEIPGSIGANCTGVTVGGFQVGSSNYFTAINRADWSSVTSFSSYSMSGLSADERDIILLVTNKSSLTTTEVKLASYIGTGNSGSTPELVALGGDRFMVIWEEFNQSSKASQGVYYTIVNGSGQVTTSKTQVDGARLSLYGSPVVSGNTVSWFVDESSARTVYQVEF